MNTIKNLVSLDPKQGSHLVQLPPLSDSEIDAIAESEEQLHKQASLNIGMIGHVAHGKSSFVRAVSGVTTTRHSKEQIRNSTLQLGYANFKIFRCDNMLCMPPECYQSHPGTVMKAQCRVCDSSMSLIRHISFVDCPGHEMLMRTMLNGAAVMDAAVLVIAANERVPQPQTVEHLVAAEIMHLNNIVAIQSKVDLVTPAQADENKNHIKALLDGTIAQGATIIPVCCTPKLTANIDYLLQHIVNKIPQPVRDLKSPAVMKIIRSFDINKPGTPLQSLRGGVCGGSAIQGVLRVGELVEIRPGIISSGPCGKTYSPLVTRVTQLFSESKALDFALPGGLIGVGTLLDPVLTGKNRLVGNVLGRLGALPDVFIALELKYQLLRNVVGDSSSQRVTIPLAGEEMLLTVGSASVRGRVVSVKGSKRTGHLACILSDPVCTAVGEHVSISRKVKTRFRLIGWCTVIKGQEAVRKDIPLPTKSC